jgi:hypothetical protein
MLGTSTTSVDVATLSGAGDVEERHALASCDDAADPISLPVVALSSIPSSASLVILPQRLAAFSLSVVPVSGALNGRRDAGDPGRSAFARTGLEGDERRGHGSSVQLILLLAHPGLDLFPGCEVAQQLERRSEVSPKSLGQVAFHSEAANVTTLDALKGDGATAKCHETGNSLKHSGYMRR